MAQCKKKRADVFKQREVRDIETTKELEDLLRTYEEKQRKGKEISDGAIKVRTDNLHKRNQSLCSRTSKIQTEKEEKLHAEIQRIEL